MRWLAALLMGMLLLPATLGATLAADADSGGDIDASEITKVASIDNIDISTLNTTDNFA